jgi:hypothetical protein
MSSEVPAVSGSQESPGRAPGRSRFSEYASNAIRYWEPRRFLYNLVLFGVVAAHFLAAWQGNRANPDGNMLLFLIFLAVLANVCYCAAYVVDLFVQYAGLGASWARWRWVLLLIGIVFAAVIAHFFSMGIFQERGSTWAD